MNSYNGRQITQMRFKDVRELEKFKFVSNGYDLQTERLEHVSQDKIWKSLINILMETYNKPINIPLILYDEAREEIYLGYVEGVVYTGYSVYSNSISSVDITYNSDDDILEITYTNEEIMSTDNVKTLFGNQSIIGTGNIDLYRHDITIMSTLSITVYSSSNLKIDSVQDLTTVLKPYVGLVLGGVWYDKLNGNSEIAGYGALVYKSDNLWYMLLNTTGSNNILVNSVTDVVTTI